MVSISAGRWRSPQADELVPYARQRRYHPGLGNNTSCLLSTMPCTPTHTRVRVSRTSIFVLPIAPARSATDNPHVGRGTALEVVLVPSSRQNPLKVIRSCLSHPTRPHRGQPAVSPQLSAPTRNARRHDYHGSFHDIVTYEVPPYSALIPVSYTHLRAHETPEHLVCRLLLEKKKKKI
eukprot:TRINITY_DN10185_c0_g1_i17.p1 TRINITY_DN10185_c0_g1~~TRINITY_DN10185_c0_g1_i17.p1  ORF type:complete len:178 (+),score=7.65 TRINITY_DN10185_c0_g1_i17:438-971(+)